MPLDHYISQVHLKRFYSPKLENRLFAIRKRDLKFFTPTARDVCRIDEGSTNAYLREDRAIENFLRSIEPNYNLSVEKLKNSKIDQECIYTIAGFAAFIQTCSPAGMRIYSEPLKGAVEMAAKTLDSYGKIPPPPPKLGGTTLTELLDSGRLKIKIDPKYPQALGISNIISLTSSFGNFQWEILENDFEDSPFFTSDYPVTLEETKDPRLKNKVIPLDPKIAIRILPDVKVDQEQIDLNFSRFSYKRKKLNSKRVAKINRLIVRCAEELVFFCEERQWTSKFIEKNCGFRINPRTQMMKTPGGKILISTQDVGEINSTESRR